MAYQGHTLMSDSWLALELELGSAGDALRGQESQEPPLCSTPLSRPSRMRTPLSTSRRASSLETRPWPLRRDSAQTRRDPDAGPGPGSGRCGVACCTLATVVLSQVEATAKS